MVNQDFRIHKYKRNGELNFRFYKIAYTAALRLGVAVNLDSDLLNLSFEGTRDFSISGHNGNAGYKGSLSIKGQQFDDVLVILGQAPSGSYYLVTFWPETQHPDAHHSYTQPLVDTAMSGAPFDIQRVAGFMHDRFKENAGVSPAALMNLIYREDIAALGSESQKVIDEISKELEQAYQDAESAKRALEAVQNDYVEMMEVVEEQSNTIESQLQELASTKDELEALKASIKLSTSSQQVIESTSVLVKEHARPVTSVWRSKTGSGYKNLGVLGYVRDVRADGNNILLDTIDTKGREITLRDFGYQGFVEPVFKYLERLKNQPAVFLITWKDGQEAKLAADTMMLPQYKDLWA